MYCEGIMSASFDDGVEWVGTLLPLAIQMRRWTDEPMTRLAIRFQKYAALALMCLSLPATAHAQNSSLREQALDFAKNEFAARWLISGDQWFLYYEVPPNPFTPVLGQQGAIRAYVQAVEITANNESEKQINEADIANGLLWQERVTFTATRARIYDFSSGWRQWEFKPKLMAIDVENRNNRWSSTASYLLQLPDYATYRKPVLSELPAEGEGPRPVPPSQQSRSCSVPCTPTDTFCSSVVQKMTELSACAQGNDATLYNKFSDAGWYYCNKKQVGTDGAVRGFEAIKSPANSVEAQLDAFAVQAALQYRCR